MAYDRVKALDYARRHWDIPCDDGVVWLDSAAILVAQKRKELSAPETAGWVARFRPDGSGGEEFIFEKGSGASYLDIVVQGWNGLADCAHFLSKSLSAGGAKVSELGVGELIRTLQARNDTRTLVEKVGKAGGQRVIDAGLLKPGDMIGYFNVSDSGDYNGARRYTHSTMFCGTNGAAGDKGHVTCHTKSRFMGLSPKEYGDDWDLGDKYAYTFIHFSEDDAARASVGKDLAGWWKIEYGARVEYYFILADGRAFYTLTKPASATRVLTAGSAAGRATWLNSAPLITFCWRNTGTVETWAPVPFVSNLFLISVNGVVGRATRLF